MHGLDIIGLDLTFGFGDLFKAAGGMAAGAATYIKQENEANAAKAALDQKTQAIIAADNAATSLLARSLMSTSFKLKTAATDKAASDKAQTAQDRAARDLPDAVVPARIAAAQKALDAAQDKKDQFAITAAQRTLDKANGIDVDAKATKEEKPPKKSNTMLYAALAAGAAGFAYAMLRRKRSR